MSRFVELATSQLKRFRSNGNDDKQQEPLVEKENARLQEWIRGDVCKKELLPFLDKLIGDNGDLRRSALNSHPTMAYYQGKTDAFTELKAVFLEWRQ